MMMAQTATGNVLVDLKGFCAFCLNLENGVSKCFPRPPLGSCTLKTFLEYWSIIQQPISNLTELSGPIPTFVITGDSPEVIPFHSNAPPMCSSCSGRFGTILACQNEILQLQMKMEMLKRRVEDCLKEVRGVISANTSIVSAGVQGQFDEDTASFLRQVYSKFPNQQVPATSTSSSDAGYRPINSPLPCPPTKDVDEPPAKKSKVGPEVEETNLLRSEEEDEDEVKSEAPSEDYHDRNGEQSQSQSDFEYRHEENENEEKPFVEASESGTDVDVKKDPLELQLETKSENRRGSATLAASGEFRPLQLCEICDQWVLLVDLYDHMKSHVGDYVFRCPLSKDKGCKFAFLSRFSENLFQRHSVECLGPLSTKKLKLRCKECNLKCRSIKHLGIHLRCVHEKSEDKTFPCPIPECGQSFTVKQSVEFHLRTHAYYFVRTKLRKKGVKIKKIKRGKRPTRMFEKTYSCEICGEAVPLKDRLQHLRNHVGNFLYKCPEQNCEKVFASRYSQDLTDHKHTAKVKYDCDICGEKLGNKSIVFKEHMERHETLAKYFTCPIKDCGETFTFRQTVEYHLRSHAFELTSKRTLQLCSLCNDLPRVRYTPSDMETHLKTVHEITEEHLVRCNYCDFIFPNREQYLDHIGSHMGKQEPVKCDLCPSSSSELFSRCLELRQHYLECHKIGKQYICEYCCKPYCTIQSLNNHKKSSHGDKVRIFRCEECSKQFTNRTSLDAHNIRDHGAEPFKCKFCEETFTIKVQRNQHEKIHTNPEILQKERPKFPCSICGREFPNLGQMKAHKRRVHLTTERNFKCDVESCGKTYKAADGLRTHVRRTHEGIREICEICGKGIVDAKSLKTHYLIHTGERPFVCDICGLRFRQSAALFTHKKGHEKHGPNFVSRTFDRTPKE